MIKLLIIFLLVFTFIYVLYMKGMIPISVKSAVMFIGGPGCKKATFTSCNGYIKRIVKFKKDKVYNFTLHSNLTAGSIAVELIDKNKQTVLRLDEDNTVVFGSNHSGPYTLMIRFHSATGEYELDWN